LPILVNYSIKGVNLMSISVLVDKSKTLREKCQFVEESIDAGSLAIGDLGKGDNLTIFTCFLKSYPPAAIISQLDPEKLILALWLLSVKLGGE